MLRTLLLLRHGASHQDNSTDDLKRSLTTSGIHDCMLIGHYLYRHQLIPEWVLCSNALRTRQTAQHVLNGLHPQPTIIYDPTLYLSTAGEMLKSLAQVADTVTTVLIVAHHPGLQHLVTFLASSSSVAPAAATRQYPTAGLVHFSIHARGWEQVDSSSAEFRHFIDPKMLKENT